jgi:hypothetical protein
MPDKLTAFSYLWDGSEPGWVLLKAPELTGGYCIFNETHPALLHIDDDELNDRLCRYMKQIGIKTIDSMPIKGDVHIEPIE